MKTYHDVIDEVVQLYKDNPRSFVEREEGLYNCVYENGGIGCAFKACCRPEVSLKEYDIECVNASQILRKEGFQILKPEYQHLTDRIFWRMIQILHDSSQYWETRNGGNLTEDGKEYVAELKQMWPSS